jgi:hypothetical protein
MQTWVTCRSHVTCRSSDTRRPKNLGAIHFVKLGDSDMCHSCTKGRPVARGLIKIPPASVYNALSSVQPALDQDVSVKCHEICSNNAPFVICRHLSKSLKRSQLTAPVADLQIGPDGVQMR